MTDFCIATGERYTKMLERISSTLRDGSSTCEPLRDGSSETALELPRNKTCACTHYYQSRPYGTTWYGTYHNTSRLLGVYQLRSNNSCSKRRNIVFTANSWLGMSVLSYALRPAVTGKRTMEQQLPAVPVERPYSEP
jgi:hypothetical protein